MSSSHSAMQLHGYDSSSPRRGDSASATQIHNTAAAKRKAVYGDWAISYKLYEELKAKEVALSRGINAAIAGKTSKLVL